MKTYISFIILSCIALTLSVTTGRKLKCADDLKIKACYLPNTDTTGVRTTYVKSCSKENSAEKQDSMMVMMILVIVKTLEFVLKQ